MKNSGVLIALILIGTLAALAAAPAGYRVVKTVALGGEGGWDYLNFDTAQHRLFIARATRVMVVDPDSGKSLGEIPNTPGVHGIALAQNLGRGFTSNGRENMVTIFDLKTLKVLGKVKTGDGPDAISYDPAFQRVFTFNGRSDDSTAIDAKDGKVAGTIPLKGRPEFAVPDGHGRIYINLEDKSELLEVDTQNLKVMSRWPLAPCEEPTGLAIDPEHRRLFVGCSNRRMAVVNSDTGKVITTLPIGAGVDATQFDSRTQLAFASNGDGTLTIVR